MNELLVIIVTGVFLFVTVSYYSKRINNLHDIINVLTDRLDIIEVRLECRTPDLSTEEARLRSTKLFSHIPGGMKCWETFDRYTSK